ncbi:MAG: hypothetical protein Q8R72_06535 [Hylemonella sp.]|nr:hypothetical protein [Hylemonella sp.]
MHRYLLPLGMAFLLSACSPTLNWREVLPGGELRALLPCKPDQGSRQQSLAGREVEVRMVGCEAAGALYAVSVAELGEAGHAMAVQAQWQASLLANMQARESDAHAWALKGASAQLEPVRLTARGLRPDGQAVAVQAAWFVRGTRLYHAVIYAERISTEMSEPFFDGLALP